MYQVVLGIIAVIILFIIGYITINCDVRDTYINLAEKAVFSLFSFFIAPYIFYILHLIFNGNIFSNKAIFYSVFVIYIAIHLFFASKKIKSDVLEIKGRFFNPKYWNNKKSLKNCSN